MMKRYRTLLFFIFFSSAINAAPIEHDRLQPALKNMMKNWAVLFEVFSKKLNYRECGEKNAKTWDNTREKQKFGEAKKMVDGYVSSTRKIKMDHSGACKVDFLQDLLKKHNTVQAQWNLLGFTCQDRLAGKLEYVDTAQITTAIKRLSSNF